jgi:DNA-binding LacI/PurR family transcriptional regulator
MMPNYSGSNPRKEDFLSYISQRVSDLLAEKNEVVILVAFQKSPTGPYNYRIYSVNNKDDFFSSCLHEIANDLARRGYDLSICQQTFLEEKKNLHVLRYF